MGCVDKVTPAEIKGKAAGTCTCLCGQHWGDCASVDQPGRADPGDEHKHITPLLHSCTSPPWQGISSPGSNNPQIKAAFTTRGWKSGVRSLGTFSMCIPAERSLSRSSSSRSCGWQQISPANPCSQFPAASSAPGGWFPTPGPSLRQGKGSHDGTQSHVCPSCLPPPGLGAPVGLGTVL